MKSVQLLISILVLAYASINLNAQSENDTIRVTYKGKGVTVRPQGDESNTTIKFKDTLTKKNIIVKVSAKDMNEADGDDADADMDSTLKKTIKILSDKLGQNKRKHFIETSVLPNFDIGFVSTANEMENDYTINPRFSKSANINLGIVKQDMNLYKGQVLFSYGFGLNNYYLKYNDRQSMQYVDKQGLLNTYTDTVNNIRKNRVDLFYLSVPLLLEYHSKNDGFNIAAGVEFNFGGRSLSVTKGSRESLDFKHKDDNEIKINPTQLNAVLRIGSDHIALYGRYSITDMYQSSAYANNTNPHQHLFSIGICLFGI